MLRPPKWPGAKSSAHRNVVERGAVQIRTARNRQGQGLGNGLEHVGTGLPRRDLGIRGERGNHCQQFLRRGIAVGNAVCEQLRQIRVGRLPGVKSDLPGGVLFCQFGAVRGEEGVGFRGHKEVFVFRQAQRFARRRR
jgi:hypothetical protein